MSVAQNKRLDASTLILLAAAGLYVAVYLIFFPAALTIMDEASYFNTAYAFRHGTFYLDEIGVPSIMGYWVGQHAVSQYPPGMPALISLVSLLGWKAAMATNLVVHLGTFAVIAAILRRIQVPPAFAVLYLLFPTAVIYSRTVMSDLASGLLVTLAFWGYLANRHWASGLCLGAAMCVRTPNSIFVALLGLAILLESRRVGEATYNLRGRILSIIQLGVGTVPLIAAAYAYQILVQEGGWSKYLTGAASFGVHYFPGQFLSYVVTLSVLWPLMFFAPAFYSAPGKIALRLLAYGIIGLYSFYYYRDSTGSFIESTIIGLRFILVILPLFIIAYAQVLWTFYQRSIARRFPVRATAFLSGVAALLLLAGTVAIHYKHQNYLKQAAGVRDGILSAVPPNDILFCNMNVAKILQPTFGRRQVYMLALAGTEKGVMKARTLIDTALERKDRRVIVAIWGAAPLTEASEEQKQLRVLELFYEVHPLPKEAPPGLPDDVRLFQVRERSKK